VTNGRFFGTFFVKAELQMADPKEPKKETVRITLPPRAASSAPPVSTPRDTVRINLPARPPSNGGLPRPPAPASPPPPVAPSVPAFRPPSSTPAFSAPGASTQAASALRAPEPMAEPPSAPSPGPKKETARISILPDPPKPSGSVQMKKTQPLISMPEVKSPISPVTVAPRESESVLENIPMSLCWTLVGGSALILLIQIWTYIS
jgi:hypothetical protein